MDTSISNIDLSGKTTNSNDIITINNAISNLSTNKADVTITDDLTTKLTDLSYDANDFMADNLTANILTVNNSLIIDGTFIISNDNYDITDEQFGFLKDISENVKTSLENITSNVTTNASNISDLQTTIASHTTTLSNHTSALSTNATEISDIQSTLSDHTSALSTNATDMSDIVTTVNLHTTTLSSHTTSISTINSTLTGLDYNKQNVINSSNRLNSNLLRGW